MQEHLMRRHLKGQYAHKLGRMQGSKKKKVKSKGESQDLQGT